MRNKIKMFLAALLATTVMTVGTAVPAQAAYLDCAGYPGTICFTEFPNFTGQVWRQFPGQISGRRNVSPENFDNEASTAFNNTPGGYYVAIWQYQNCTGASFSLASGSYYVFTGNWWNDKMSSIEVIAL